MAIKATLTLDVCATYLLKSECSEDELLKGMGASAPEAIAEMMRDPAIPVYSF